MNGLGDQRAVTRLLLMSAALHQRNLHIAGLEHIIAGLKGLTRELEDKVIALDQANADAHGQLSEMADQVAALEQALTDTEARLVAAEEQVRAWEALADTLGPVTEIGRP